MKSLSTSTSMHAQIDRARRPRIGGGWLHVALFVSLTLSAWGQTTLNPGQSMTVTVSLHYEPEAKPLTSAQKATVRERQVLPMTAKECDPFPCRMGEFTSYKCPDGYAFLNEWNGTIASSIPDGEATIVDHWDEDKKLEICQNVADWKAIPRTPVFPKRKRAPLLLAQIPDSIPTEWINDDGKIVPDTSCCYDPYTPIDFELHPRKHREPVDVPAIQEYEDEVIGHDANDCVLISAHQAATEHPMKVWWNHACWARVKDLWTCADRSRILLSSEDGKKHCIRFPQADPK